MNKHIKILIDCLGGTQEKASKELEITQPLLSYLLNEKSEITPQFAVKAEIKSKGIVKRVDLLPEVFGELTYESEVVE